MTRVLLLLAFAVAFWAVGASAQPSELYLDFDSDGLPWTIRTVIDTCGAPVPVRVVLLVGDPVPNGQDIEGWIYQGCCIQGGITYFGTFGSFGFGTEFLDPLHPVWVTIPEGDPSTWPCPGPHYGTGGRLANSLPDDFRPGTYHFIGSGSWDFSCQEPCDPPTEFQYTFGIGGVVSGTGTMTFGCSPSPADGTTWGEIKTLFR